MINSRIPSVVRTALAGAGIGIAGVSSACAQVPGFTRCLVNHRQSTQAVGKGHANVAPLLRSHHGLTRAIDLDCSVADDIGLTVGRCPRVLGLKIFATEFLEAVTRRSDGFERRCAAAPRSPVEGLWIEVSGYFWVPENPDVRVWGAFSADGGHKPEAVLAGGLVSDPRVVKTNRAGGRALLSSVAATSKAIESITLQGQLETGHAITLVNASNYGKDGGYFGSPHYKADYAVFGDRHVSGVDQLFRAIRFRFGDPYWLGHLREGKLAAVDSAGSTLGVETSDDGNWLVYTAASPATLRQLRSRVVMSCVTLAELVLDQDFAARDTNVRISDTDPWLSVLGPDSDVPPNEFDSRTLLAREELTVARFARWIPFYETVDGLASVAARPIKAPLQTQVLVLTSLVEGLHRRMPRTFEQSRFAGASPSVLKRIKEAAGRAAMGTAMARRRLDPQQVHGAVMTAVSHFEEVDYLERATAVVNNVCAVLPEVTEFIDDLPMRLTDARDEMAHHLPLDKKDETLGVRHLRWLVVASATPWLLRGLLLLQAGIEPDVLHERHLTYRHFFDFRVTAANLINELDEKPSQ